MWRYGSGRFRVVSPPGGPVDPAGLDYLLAGGVLAVAAGLGVALLRASGVSLPRWTVGVSLVGSLGGVSPVGWWRCLLGAPQMEGVVLSVGDTRVVRVVDLELKRKYLLEKFTDAVGGHPDGPAAVAALEESLTDWVVVSDTVAGHLQKLAPHLGEIPWVPGVPNEEFFFVLGLLIWSSVGWIYSWFRSGDGGGDL